MSNDLITVSEYPFLSLFSMWSHRYLTLPSRVPHSSRQDARCLWNSMTLSSDCGREGIRTAEGSSSAAASRVKWRSQDGSRLGFHC
ncbi:unnamed protein product [Brassica napus]|uniref:(rape) hypothetical protein n=1 Tax=Brassica napus TaxID=3708 RepID=A0A816Q6P6_BRANA|nr:unnamed protein product [Brassica napus]